MGDTYFLKVLKQILQKYSQAEAANLLEVSSKSISNYIAGQNPHPKTIRKAEEVLKKFQEEDNKSLSSESSKKTIKSEVSESDLDDKSYQELISIIRSQQDTIKILSTKVGNVNGHAASSA